MNRSTRRQWYNEFGRHAELYVARELRALGHAVDDSPGLVTCDLLIDDKLRGEVKAAFLTHNQIRNNAPQWQFSFNRHGTEISADVIFLCCYDKAPSETDDKSVKPIAVFVIPGNRLAPDQRKVSISSARPQDYNGRYRPYLDHWHLVRFIKPRAAYIKRRELAEPIEAIPF